MKNSTLTQGEERDLVQKLERQRDEQHRNDWRWLMLQPEGRRIVWDLIFGAGGLNTLDYTPGPSRHPEMEAAFNSGRRMLAQKILEEAQDAGLDNYLLMVRERTEGLILELGAKRAAKGRDNERENHDEEQ